jgi:uncharacterized membrane protein YidH (DUF202 family)
MGTRTCVADTIYRALLRLYPIRFQEEFASDMALDFADASDDAWLQRRWTGLCALWVRVAADLTRSLLAQWIRTRTPLFALIAFVVALTTVSTLLAVAPSGQVVLNVKPHDRELIELLLVTACMLLIVAATIIMTVCFLRPMIRRGQTRMRIRPITLLPWPSRHC